MPIAVVYTGHGCHGVGGTGEEVLKYELYYKLVYAHHQALLAAQFHSRLRCAAYLRRFWTLITCVGGI